MFLCGARGGAEEFGGRNEWSLTELPYHGVGLDGGGRCDATDLEVTAATGRIVTYCDEFLVHAADVEGNVRVSMRRRSPFGAHAPIPVTYAGGVSLEDLQSVERISAGGWT